MPCLKRLRWPQITTESNTKRGPNAKWFVYNECSFLIYRQQWVCFKIRIGCIYEDFTMTSMLTWDSPHLMETWCWPRVLIFSLRTKRLSKITSYSPSFSAISSLVTEPNVAVVSGMTARTNSRGPGNADSSANNFRAAVSWRLIPMDGSTIWIVKI